MDGIQMNSAQKTLNFFIRKEETSQANDLNFHSKKAEKMGKQNSKPAVIKKE